MSTPQVSEEDIVRRLAAEIRILEGSVNALQSRLEIVRAAISEITVAHDTIDGLKKLQDGDPVLVPVGAGSYIRMSIADSKKLVMGIGAGAAMEKNIESSVDDLKSRLQDLEKARTAIQQQLEQTLGRYQQDRDALEEILQQRETGARKTG
ncbi:MAG: prefoldin subunit alpha [Candidatus Bathyarchaeia archaeon]|jgi:prefoldin alpha subunit